MPRRRPNVTGATMYAKTRMKGLNLDPKSAEAEQTRLAMEAEYEALPQDKKDAMEKLAQDHNDKLAKERQQRKERRLRKLQRDGEEAKAAAEGRPLAQTPSTAAANEDASSPASRGKSRNPRSRAPSQAAKRAKASDRDERGEFEVNGVPCVHHDGILFRIFPTKQQRL